MFEEVKEMIDSTIYTNGRGEVTAQNVNLAMQAIVDATEDKLVSLEESGLDSSGALRVWISLDESTELIPEQIAENVATYNKIVKGEPVSVVLCQGESFEGGTAVGTMPTTASYTNVGDGKIVALVAHQFFAGEIMAITGQLFPDGSVAIFTETFEIPASSGPAIVYMGVMERTEEGVTLSQTEEEKVRNAEVFKVIKDAKCRIDVFVDASREMAQEIENEGIVGDYSFSCTAQVEIMAYYPHIDGFADESIVMTLYGNAPCRLLPDGTLTSA